VIWEFLLGLGLGALVAALGYFLGWLALSGALVVVVASVLNFGFGGWWWGALPLLFIVSTGLWSRYRSGQKWSISDRFSADAARTGVQVLATMGWATILVFVQSGLANDSILYAAFVGAIATVTGDAWATQVGVLSARPPRMMTTHQRVPPGTPGAVSALGMVACLAGTWLIGIVGLALVALQGTLTEEGTWDQATLTWLPLGAAVGGIIGCLVDSFLGSAAQAVYYCPRCEKYTERPNHLPGHQTEQVRGWPWMTNEVVNLTSSVVGAAVASGMVALLAGITR
jgi:uncharacterized protein (TIGR00297 family)